MVDDHHKSYDTPVISWKRAFPARPSINYKEGVLILPRFVEAEISLSSMFLPLYFPDHYQYSPNESLIRRPIIKIFELTDLQVQRMYGQLGA